MADLSQFFDDVDDRAVAPSTGIPDPVPPGEYTLQADKLELVATKDGTGMMLKAELSVVAGEFEGRKIFPQFNIRNKSSQAQTIGIGEFKAMSLACGVDYEVSRTDTDQLLYKPFRAMVGMEKEQINPTTGIPYPPKNRVTKYIPSDLSPAPVRSAAPIPAAAAPRQAPAPGVARPATPQAGRPWDKAAR